MGNVIEGMGDVIEERMRVREEALDSDEDPAEVTRWMGELGSDGSAALTMLTSDGIAVEKKVSQSSVELRRGQKDYGATVKAYADSPSEALRLALETLREAEDALGLTPLS